MTTLNARIERLEEFMPDNPTPPWMRGKLMEHFGVESLDQLPIARVKEIVSALKGQTNDNIEY
jgi:hypothetical protein